MDKETKKGIKISDILLYVVFTLLMIFVISMKIDYHMDETLTYGLSNHAGSYYMEPIDGIRYEPSIQPYIDYLGATSLSPSSFWIPYINQASDSHPPIYYMIIHFVCGLFKRTFSRWQAGSVNILFALGTLFLVRKMISLLTDNKLIYRSLSWAFVFCSAILSEVSFFRMYVMVIFLTTLTTYLFIWQIEKERGILFYALISIVVLTGALTHYGTLIYSALICITYGIYLLIHKKWKDAVIFCVLMGIAAGIAIGVYPAIIHHVFGAGRGGESIGNLFDLSDIFSRYFEYFSFFDRFVFGRMLILILVSIVVLFFYQKKKDHLKLDEKTAMKYIIVIVPAALFFCVATKSSPYIEERYTSAIYATVFVGVLCPLMILVSKCFNEKIARIVTVSFLLLMSLISLAGNGWQYLYRHEKKNFDILDNYAENDCICIYSGESWRINTYIIELTKYNSLTFIKQGDIDQYDLESFITTDNGIIVLAGVFDDSYMNEVMERLPDYKGYDYLCERSFFVYR